jgi:phosphatidylinositol 3,5-bisphosphate 5-phosphatase
MIDARATYMILITKKSPVALVGGKYIYHIDESQMLKVSLPNPKGDVKEDARYEQIFGQVDIHKNFYFSYHYDVSRTLQHNLSESRSEFDPNTMFLWNYNLIERLEPLDKCWMIPIIHGFVDQSSNGLLNFRAFSLWT